MEIPNYGNGNYSRSDFKQLYPYMPKDTFRMLICGDSGSGKTNLLCHWLQAPLLYYDQIHLYTKNLDQDKYKSLMKNMDEISNDIGYNVVVCSNDKILPVSQMNDKFTKNCCF